MTINSASKEKFREPGATQAAPGRCHPCWQRGGMAGLAMGCTVWAATSKAAPRLSVGCRSPLSGADGHTWPQSHTVCQGSPVSSGTGTQHVPPAEGKPLPKHRAATAPSSSWARQPLEEGAKKELQKQGQLKVEIRHHLWKRFWKSFFVFKPDCLSISGSDPLGFATHPPNKYHLPPTIKSPTLKSSH